jgi:smad nuclear-interacting protein 1
MSSDETHRPYIIDLESTNGTKVNETTIPPAQYYELHVNDGA